MTLKDPARPFDKDWFKQGRVLETEVGRWHGVDCIGYRKTVFETGILYNTHTHTMSPVHSVIEDPGPSLLSEYHKVSQYIRTCSDIYTHSKYMGLLAQISWKLQILLRSITCGFFLNRNPIQIWCANTDLNASTTLQLSLCRFSWSSKQAKFGNIPCVEL